MSIKSEIFDSIQDSKEKQRLIETLSHLEENDDYLALVLLFKIYTENHLKENQSIIVQNNERLTKELDDIRVKNEEDMKGIEQIIINVLKIIESNINSNKDTKGKVLEELSYVEENILDNMETLSKIVLTINKKVSKKEQVKTDMALDKASIKQIVNDTINTSYKTMLGVSLLFLASSAFIASVTYLTQ